MALNICLGGRIFLGPTYANGTLNFYDVGTLDAQIVYQDKNGTIPHDPTITLDEYGSAVVFLKQDAKMVAKTADATEMYTQDGGLVPSSTTESNDNRVTNGSAEIDSDSDGIPDNWTSTPYTSGTNERVSSDQVHGAWCFKSLDGGNGGGVWLHDNYIPVSENEEMGWDFELICSHVNVRNLVELLWYDKDKNQLTGGSASTTLYDEAAANPTSWTRKYGTVTPPATAVYCRPQMTLCHSSAASSGKYSLLDDLQLGKPTLAHFMTTTGDIVYADAANSPARLAKGADRSFVKGGASIPEYGTIPGFLYGMEMSNDTDADHDILVSAGECADSTNEVHMAGSALTKQIDATWAAGDDAGGMNDGETVQADTWYHVFALSSADGATIDYGFDSSLTAANLLADTAVIAAGLTKYRRIGSVLTDGSANILAFKQKGDHVYWDAPVSFLSGAGVATPTNYTVDAPLGVETIALLGIFFQPDNSSTGDYLRVYCPNLSAQTAGAGNFNVASAQWTNIGGAGSEVEVLTDTSSQVTIDQSTATATQVEGITLGYIDRRGKDG